MLREIRELEKCADFCQIHTLGNCRCWFGKIRRINLLPITCSLEEDELSE